MPPQLPLRARTLTAQDGPRRLAELANDAGMLVSKGRSKPGGACKPQSATTTAAAAAHRHRRLAPLHLTAAAAARILAAVLPLEYGAPARWCPSFGSQAARRSSFWPRQSGAACRT